MDNNSYNVKKFPKDEAHVMFENFLSNGLIDITDTHDEDLNADFMATIDIAIKEIRKTGNESIRQIPRHFFVKYPHIMISWISDSTINTLLPISYDWNAHRDYIVTQTIASVSTDKLVDRLEYLRLALGVDYLSFDLSSCGLLGTRIDKFFVLVDAGLAYGTLPEIILSSVLHLDDHEIDRLIELGFNMKNAVNSYAKNSIWNFRMLLDKFLDKLLKYYPNCEHIASLLIDNHVKSILKTLIADYDVDIISALNIENPNPDIIYSDDELFDDE
jgi:hypothetical protein